MGDLLEPSGAGAGAGAGADAAAREDRPELLPSTSMSSNPSPLSIGPERWARAEKATQMIINKVQPSAVSEERRREVIDYVQRLIRTCLGCEVFPYGSVPLKTYLPDGDIDLTAFGGVNSEDVLADDMVSVLEGEDQNRAAEFVVKDVQLIRAEVKLVKCIVQNIVVDISFNQIGGLCTLCFLEQVDRLIGKDHLFKRSIILIKAWCYYESRILGAHHGLISTYALETLVLYIFHLFHLTLNGPVAVLYKFLDYFSKFDWENYCISLTGPFRLSSLPEFFETAEYGGGDLLLSSDFLRYCIDTFSVPSRGVDLNSHTFQPKHLNIVDPLKQHNNLGRSVSKGNFYRIRSAFTYGARKLGQILMQPEDDIDDGLCKFFSNTLDRHVGGQRPDVQCPRPVCSYNVSSPALKVLETELCPLEKVILESKPASYVRGDFRFNPNGSPQNGFNDMKASGVEAKWSKDIGEQVTTIELLPSKISSEADQPQIGNALDHRISGDAKDLATVRVESLRISNELPKYPDLDSQESASPYGTPYHAPHLYFCNSMFPNGDLRNENLDQTNLKNIKENMYCGISHGSDGGINGCSLEKDIVSDEDDVLVSIGLEDGNLAAKSVSYPENLHHVSWDWSSASVGTLEPLNPKSDLRGDYDSHFSCLQYGRWCFEHASSMPALTMPPPPPSLFWMNSWDGVQHQSQFKQNGFSHGSGNGVIPTPAFYTVNPLLIPGTAFGLEDMPKPRGTGTYFPNTNRPPQGYRPSAVKARNQTSSSSPRNNGRNAMFMETNMLDHTSREFSQSSVSVYQSDLKNGSSDIHQSFNPRGKGHPNSNALVLQSEGGLEFGSVGHIPVEAPLLEGSRQRLQRSVTPSTQNSSPVSPTAGMQKLRPVLSRDHDRVSVKSSYHLKDEDDFPPLSV